MKANLGEHKRKTQKTFSSAVKKSIRRVQKRNEKNTPNFEGAKWNVSQNTEIL